MNRRELFKTVAALVTGAAVSRTTASQPLHQFSASDFPVTEEPSDDQFPTVTIHLDGRAIARAVVDHLPREIMRRGSL